MVRQLGYATVLIAFACSTVLGADTWIGQKVFCKPDAKAKVRNQLVKIELLAFPSEVEAVNGDWLWLGRAWVRKHDVMSSQQALDYYTDQIQTVDSSQARNWTKRGLVWNAAGEFEKARKDYSEAIKIDPKYAFAYNALAWLSATCPDEHFRDGKNAVANATTACTLTAWKEAEYMDTLAAAYAESGDFPIAIIWEEKALAFVTKQPGKHLWRERLALYTAGKPYRDVQEEKVARQIDRKGWQPFK